MKIHTHLEFHSLLDASSDVACQNFVLGLMLARLVERHPTTMQSLSWHVDQICKAITERRLDLYFDACGRWVGSLFWKYLGNLGEAAVLAGADPVDFDDTASDKPWIAHFDANKVDLPVLLRHAVEAGPLSSIDQIAYARVRQGRWVAKRLRLPARLKYAPATTASDGGFLANDRKGQQQSEALEMLSKACRLGEWARLSSKSPQNAQLKLVNFVNAVTLPLHLGHYIEVRATSGNLEAFLAYGLLTERGLARFRLQGPNALSPACFSEGDIVTAVCADATSSCAVQSALAKQAAALHNGLRREFGGTSVTALDDV